MYYILIKYKYLNEVFYNRNIHSTDLIFETISNTINNSSKKANFDAHLAV